jgi:hypothetical protein
MKKGTGSTTCWFFVSVHLLSLVVPVPFLIRPGGLDAKAKNLSACDRQAVRSGLEFRVRNVGILTEISDC